ncbi:MAG: hypothetical protein HY908_07060 [Myxococcales bacterium]|nr:hypothetical protein [Myxococcales bacterium]
MARNAARLRPEHEALVRQLTSLPEDERQAVVAAAEAAAQQRPVASWATLRKLSAAVSLGGDAVEDCKRLYDG